MTVWTKHVLYTIMLIVLFNSCSVFPAEDGKNVISIPSHLNQDEVIDLSTQVRPAKRQNSWQQKELSALIHFGLNTFTNDEIGDGRANPVIFNPTELRVDQWISTIKNAGFERVIITAKHHDGFCLWPSAYSSYTIAQSPYEDGQGDLVEEVANSCRDYGLAFGIYVSPWDRHEKTYGSEMYNRFFMDQMTELLSNYGDLDEVWLDGTNGEGPDGKQQIYDWNGYYNLIRRLQPNAVISIRGPDVRWSGSENGYGRETEWSVLPIHVTSDLQIQSDDQGPIYYGQAINPMDIDLGSRQKLVNANYLIWYPSQVKVSIRPGWFYHAEHDYQVKDAQSLLDIFFGSVGRNSSLLLGLAINKKGLLPERDVSSLLKFKNAYDQIFSTNYARDASIEPTSTGENSSTQGLIDDNTQSYWCPQDDDDTPTLTISFDQPRTFNIISIQEQISFGQRVETFLVEHWKEDKWVRLAQGTTIGYKRILQTPTVTTEHIRIIITKARSTPHLGEVGLFKNLPEVTFEPKGVAFNDQIRIELMADDTTANIYYTLDGSSPTAQSELYTEPLVFDNTTQLKAISVLPNGLSGHVQTQVYNKAKYKVLLENAPDIRYTSGGSLILTDDIFGGNQYDNNRWLGFLEEDFIAVIDLNNRSRIHSIMTNFLSHPAQSIYLPLSISYYISDNLRQWRRLASATINRDIGADVYSHSISKQFKQVSARYLKIVVKNQGTIPEGEIGEGKPSWIFIDEISIDTN